MFLVNIKDECAKLSLSYVFKHFIHKHSHLLSNTVIKMLFLNTAKSIKVTLHSFVLHYPYLESFVRSPLLFYEMLQFIAHL